MINLVSHVFKPVGKIFAAAVAVGLLTSFVAYQWHKVHSYSRTAWFAGAGHERMLRRNDVADDLAESRLLIGRSEFDLKTELGEPDKKTEDSLVLMEASGGTWIYRLHDDSLWGIDRYLLVGLGSSRKVAWVTVFKPAESRIAR